MAPVIEPTPSSPDPDPHGRPYGPSGAAESAHRSGSWSHRRPAEQQGPGARREALGAVLWTLALAVLGAGLGLLWLWLAPRVPLYSDGKAVFLKDPEGEEAVGADGTFVLLGLAFGAVTGLLAFARDRSGGVGRLLGLTAGAVAGSVVAWRLGVWLGPSTDVVAAAKSAGTGRTFDGPLKLQLPALLAWPFAAVLVHAVLLWLFGRRDVPSDGAAGLALHAASDGG